MPTETDVKPRSLLALNADMYALEDMITESGGDMTDDAIAAIQAWMGDLSKETNAKADAYLGLMREFELRAEAIRAEAKRLAGRANVCENAGASLRERLRWFMDQHQIKSIDTGRFKATIKGNGGAVPVEVLDESMIPETFFDFKPVLDKKKLREALEKGVVPGAKLGERGTSLQIK